ncbi:hypothetical protein DFJ63DRAFT_175935, partial [Scheffersomyces coipomensis]|uniref:uncharacterized protein n=1 Tax=Scheffersomyces coipomensis TaxID=1788519 RepID=UPI00315DE0BC
MSSYPYQLTTTSNKDELLQRYKGKPLRDLPTPSIVINKAKFESNCNKMLVNAKKLDANFRAHIKTHKTLEGTLLQLGTVPFKTEKIVVSTMMEAWNILPLVKSGLIIDVHFSLPVVKSRLSELAEFSNVVPHLRIMLDDIEQLDVLANFNKTNPGTNKWSVFIKIDMGTHRAGLIADTERLNQTLAKVLTEDSIKEAVEVYGFYCHAGHSYASTSSNTAKTYLIEEIKNANIAAITA